MSLASLYRSATIQELTIAQPALAAEWAVTVPTGQRWRLETLFYTYLASAVVANRFPSLTISDGTNLVWRSSEISALTASNTYTIAAARLSQNSSSVTPNVAQSMFLPDVWLPPGYIVASLTPNKDSSDQYSAIRGLVAVTSDAS